MAGRILIVVAALGAAVGAVGVAGIDRPIGAADIAYSGSAVTPTFPPPARPTTTAPPSTQPPSTQPPSTQPPSTQPPATTAPPVTTGPPSTQPPSTQPPATIQPSSTTQSATSESIDARGARALATITYPWQSRLPGWTIEFLPGRPGAYGYTYTDQRRIEILVRDDQSDSLLAHVIAHELGHAVDVTLNDSAERQRWQDARGIGDAPWWPGSGATDFSTGAGDFAEAFAAWQVGSGSFRSNLAGPPTPDQLALMAELAG